MQPPGAPVVHTGMPRVSASIGDSQESLLLQRIALRDRPYERQMERSYINELNIAYDEFFSRSFDHTPVLTIDSNDLNVIQKGDDLKLIENRIRQSLSLPPFQQALPLP